MIDSHVWEYTLDNNINFHMWEYTLDNMIDSQFLEARLWLRHTARDRERGRDRDRDYWTQ